MALDQPILSRQRVLAAAVETTTGTAASLTTGGVMNVFDAKIEPTIPATERESQGSLSLLAPIPGARMGKATFKTEVVGNGAANDPYWACFLLGAGLQVSSHVYTPLTAANQTLTIGHYMGAVAGGSGARLYEITGAMGKITFDFETGKPAIMSHEFDGVWQPVTSVTMPNPTYPTVIPPRVASSTFTIGGTVLKVPKVQITLDNTLLMREDVTKDSGYAGCCIPARKITVKVSPEALSLATKDWFNDHLNHAYSGYSAMALNLVIGSLANNTITFACPNLIQLNPPGYEDSSGLMRDSLEFVAIKNSSAGDDEFSITFS
jgi:hypothetical protein